MASSAHPLAQSRLLQRLPMSRQTREMGSLSTLLLSCLQRKQRPTTEPDERPPVPAKEPLAMSSVSNSNSNLKSVASPTYTYTYTCRQSEQCPSTAPSSQSGTEKGKISNTGTGTGNPTKLSKRSSIRIVNSHDSESTLVSSSSSTSEGHTLAGSRNVSRSGSEEKDIEAGGGIEGGRTVSAIIEAGLEDLERQIRSDSERVGPERIARSCSLPEIKSRVIEDIPEEDEIVGNGTGAEQRQQQQEKELPSLPREAETAKKEADEEEEEELSTKSKSIRDSFRLSGRKSLIEMVHFLQPPSNRFSALKIPIPPKSPLRKKASASSMPSPSDLLRPATSYATTSPSESLPSNPEPLSDPAQREEKTTPRTKKHRRMGAIGLGMGIPLRVRQSLDGLNINNTGKKSLFC